MKTNPHDMTVAELQAAIGELQSILHWKVCGDPRQSVTVASVGWCRPIPKTAPGVKS
jgi:hypothetical protein